MTELEEFKVGQIWKYIGMGDVDEPKHYVILVGIRDHQETPLMFEIVCADIDIHLLPYSPESIRRSFIKVS